MNNLPANIISPPSKLHENSRYSGCELIKVTVEKFYYGVHVYGMSRIRPLFVDYLPPAIVINLRRKLCPKKKCGLLNYTVYPKSAQRTLIPWKIRSVDPPSLSFCGFFHSVVRDETPELISTFVGKSKEQTDEMDSNLAISEGSRNGPC